MRYYIKWVDKKITKTLEALETICHPIDTGRKLNVHKGGFPLVELIRAKRIFSSEFFRTKTVLISTKQKVRAFIFLTIQIT